MDAEGGQTVDLCLPHFLNRLLYRGNEAFLCQSAIELNSHGRSTLRYFTAHLQREEA